MEFYTRQVSTYVQAFLDYLSAIELVTRLQPGPYPELESKWVQFNVSMRDIKKVALDQHVSNLLIVFEQSERQLRTYSSHKSGNMLSSHSSLSFRVTRTLCWP